MDSIATWRLQVLDLSTYIVYNKSKSRYRKMNRLERNRRIQILQLLVEGNGLRATTRLVDVSPNTVSRLLILAGQACKKFHNDNVKNVEVRDWVEIDELWNYVYAKEKNLPWAVNPPYFCGDAYTHIALDSKSKLILSYKVGKRHPQETKWILNDVKERVAGDSVPIATDGYLPYSKYAPKVFGEDVPMINVIGTEKYRISGKPDIKSMGTTYVERHNLTLRTQVRRYSRKTNAISKKVSRQRAHLSLYVCWYNWCRIHKSLRMPPAMQAGLTDTLLDWDFIVDLIEAQEDPPNKPKEYKKKR